MNGGKCKKCGSVRHRAGECKEADTPRFKRLKGAEAGGAAGSGSGGGKRKAVGADEDDFMLDQWNSVKDEHKSKSKPKDKVKGSGSGAKVMEKKPFNNNGLREVYKTGGRGGSAPDEPSRKRVAMSSNDPKKVVAF